ncbi:MAG: DUF4287 domain-containing protein [Crocinitomicaceae bacterium]|jgi:hypothetical protein|nr:DUF4287 domain-containing protein [Crocinitomicaceae bacterium]
MDAQKMENGMMVQLVEKTGKNLEDWKAYLSTKSFQKHGEILKHLKGDFNITHGYANLIAHKFLKSDAGSNDNKADLAFAPYKGKEHFLPFYEELKAYISSLGTDIEFAPKNTYMSVRRKKQFALLQPATKTRYEIGIHLKGIDTPASIPLNPKSNAMLSHLVCLEEGEQISDEVKEWIKIAYEKAG